MNFSYSNQSLLEIFFRLPNFARELFAAIYSLKVGRRRFGGVFSAKLKELIQDEELSLDERVEYQFQRLKEILIYAAETTPYYRESFSRIGFDPQSIRSIDEIWKIPPLEKDTLRTHHNQLRAEHFKDPIFSNHTSGTTGSALELILSEYANQSHYACLWFHFGWAGIHRTEPIATFGGHPVVAVNRLSPPFWLYDRNENDLMFSAYHLTPKTVSSYAQKLADFKPVMIRGYPSQIYLIALHLLEIGNQNITPKGIFTYAETLLDTQRKVMEQAFNCPIYSSYGNGERTGQILQCKDGGFHIVTETCVVEVIRENGEPAKAGEIGELVITSLINKALPMIRYKTGDTGIQSESLCKCGRTSPIIREITGRIEDFVVVPDGRHLGRLDKIFTSTINIKEAQLIQERVDLLVINMVTYPGYNENDEKLLLKELRLRLGDEIKIFFHIVDEIPRTNQGKFRFVISKVPIQFNGIKTHRNNLL